MSGYESEGIRTISRHTDMIARLRHNNTLPGPLLEARARDRFPRNSVARRRIRDRVQVELVQRRG